LIDSPFWASTHRPVISEKPNLTQSDNQGFGVSPHPLEQTHLDQLQNRRASTCHHVRSSTATSWLKKLRQYHLDDTAYASSTNSNSYLVRVRIFQLPYSSWFAQECATLSRVRLLCAASIHLSNRVASTLVELPQGLVGGDCPLIFKGDPPPRKRRFLHWAILEPAYVVWFALIMDRFVT